MHKLASTTRFSDRVENYIKYRPSYPAEIVPFLSREIGLSTESVITDIGSGTGIFTELLLKNGNTVYAVEPNGPMRQAAEALLAGYPNLHSIDGTSEQTTLAANSVDIITVAQAFHWFKPKPTREEFVRILKPGGWVVLLWNDRKTDATPFAREYESLLLTHGTDYKDVSHAWGDPATMSELFGSSDYGHAVFENRQVLNLEGMLGRLLSSSYVPNSGPRQEQMIAVFTELFARHNHNGLIAFEYATNVYYGRLSVLTNNFAETTS